MVRRMITVAALALSAWMGTATANATAYGIQYWDQFTYDGISVPGGQLAHLIKGGGYHVDTDTANYISVGNLCDAGVRYTYGDGAKRTDGSIHAGCSHAGQWVFNLNRDEPRGEACAELWVGNWKRMVARQCHYISP